MADQNRVYLNQGQRAVRLFGAAFAIMGLLFVVLLLNNPGSVRVNGRPGTVGDVWFLLIPVAVGLVVAGIRFGAYLDLTRRLHVSWWGWWFWCRRQEDTLGTWERFELKKREWRGSGKNARWAVPLMLVSDRGATELMAPKEALAARRMAERFAQATGLPLREHGSDGTVERSATEMDRRMVDVVASEDLSVPRPAASRVHLQEAMRGTVVRIGPSPLLRFWPLVLLPLLMPVLFWWFLWYPGLREEAQRSWFLWAFAMAPLLMALPLALGPLLMARRQGLFGCTITADPDEGIRTPGGHLGADEIEDIRLEGDGARTCLAIISDRRWLRVGTGLPADDLRYLRACLLQGLRGRR